MAGIINLPPPDSRGGGRRSAHQHGAGKALWPERSGHLCDFCHRDVRAAGLHRLGGCQRRAGSEQTRKDRYHYHYQ